ncbi:MAG: GGDEF domain-containing protein [Pseudomonadales bacterium]|nr:GGDEF domain-containing protein [Pseudomonadales bacterium]
MSDNTEYKDLTVDDSTDEREAKRPCLIMIKGDFIGQVYELTREVTMIGRSDDVQLTVSDVGVSRKHAMIVHRLGDFFVSDLDSTNGTFLNKETVRRPTMLRDGDKVSVGDVTFKFSFQDEDDTAYHEMLRNMAVKDGLTRIFNRRYFLEALENEFDYTRRNLAPLSVIMFDIDHFKGVNDEFGHAAGDFVLKHLAEKIEHEARGYDVFARYGGEEFVFMVRGASRAEAVALAERVRQTVESAVFNYDDEALKVTISMGVSWWEGGPGFSASEDLIREADKRLYEAKRAGRNCVRTA